MIQAINQNTNTQLPQGKRNYTVFNQERVDYLVAKREQSLPHIKHVLRTSTDEGEIVESLYIVDRMLDDKVKGIPHMYPLLSKFNDTKSANIQTFLAGIYRKTQVPDAFGPLVKMLIGNSVNNGKDMQLCSSVARQLDNSKTSKIPGLHASKPPFDPNEEIGGAILEYISNYSKNKPKIDYTI